MGRILSKNLVTVPFPFNAGQSIQLEMNHATSDRDLPTITEYRLRSLKLKHMEEVSM